MKKATIMLSCMALLMFSCANDEDTVTIEPVSSLSVDYFFNGERITVDFTENPDGEIVPIESAGLTRMMEISEQYPQLIYSPVTETQMNLYANEDHLYGELNIKKWTPQKKGDQDLIRTSSSSSSSSSFLAQAVQRLTLYNDKYFLNPLLDLADPCFPGVISGNLDYWIQRRLQNFNDPSAWMCNGNNIVYNDRVSSMTLAPNSSQYAFRFFVDKNFGASSLWLYGATNETGYINLQDIRYSFLGMRHWNDKISSAKVINMVTGEEMNGIVSTGGGGSAGGYTDPGDGQGNTDLIGDFPELHNHY